MEDDSEGCYDTEISDGWSIVNYNLDMASALKASNDSGLCAEKSSKHGSNEEIDECFELTEMPLSSTDPLGVSTLNYIKKVPDSSKINASIKNSFDIHESDGETDGISVISEDEEYFNWEQAAHDNYKKTMRLIENPPHISSKESPLDFDDPCNNTVAEEITKCKITTDEIMEYERIAAQPVETTMAQVFENYVDDTINDNNELVDDNRETNDDNHDDNANDIQELGDDLDNADVIPFEEEFNDETYQQIITSSITKNFIAYAVLVAMACIAIAHFLKTGHGKEEVLEMLNELRAENEALKFKVQDLSNAYATLEAKVLSTELPALSEPTKADLTTNKLPTIRAKDLLAEFISFNAEKDLHTISMKLLTHFQNIENNKIAGDFSLIEQKIVDCISKNMKRGKNQSKNKLFRLSELERRISHKLNQLRVKGDSLNIIQWYPDESNIETESTTTNNVPIDKNINSVTDRLPVNNVPIVESMKTVPVKLEIPSFDVPDSRNTNISERLLINSKPNVESLKTVPEKLEIPHFDVLVSKDTNSINDRLQVNNEPIVESMKTVPEKMEIPNLEVPVSKDNLKDRLHVNHLPKPESIKTYPKKLEKQKATIEKNSLNDRLPAGNTRNDESINNNPKKSKKQKKKVPDYKNVHSRTRRPNENNNDRLETNNLPKAEPIKTLPEKIIKKRSKLDRENDKYSIKNGNKTKTKIPKFKSFSGKNGQNCDFRKNKTETWFINRGKGREEIRKSNSLSEWQFARGRRDLKEGDAFWYFKKI